MSNEIDGGADIRTELRVVAHQEVSGDDNTNWTTEISFEGGIFNRPALEPVFALSQFEASLRSAQTQADQNSVFLAVCDARNERVEVSILQPGTAQILGRHSEADLSIDSVDGSLRQLAVAVARSSQGTSPIVRVFNLRTTRAFQLTSGEYAEAVTTTGTCFLRLGSLSVAIIPLAVLPERLPEGTGPLWRLLAELVEVSDIAAAEPEAPADDQSEDTNVRGGRGCQLRIVPNWERSDHVADRVAPADPSEIGCAVEEAVGSLCIRGAGLNLTAHIDEEALRRGILLGRSSRCFTSFEDLDVSRVHLLIARVGDEIMAIDTASSCGSERVGVGAFRTTIFDSSVVLKLADSAVVVWIPRH